MDVCRLATRRAAWICSLSIALLVLITRPAGGADPKPARAPDEKPIRATAEAFAAAFNRASAKEVAALWTVDGSLVDERGELFKGRQAIEQQYATFFKQYPGAKIEIAIKSIDFPAASVALEDGVARVTLKDGGASSGRYSVVHVFEGGKWLMASVREASAADASGADRLADLDWLIGKWESKSGEAAFESTFRWIVNKTFIQRDYATRQNGRTVASGIQIIGWDPEAGQIRSWAFDASGGLGAGSWQKVAAGWRIESTGVLLDGAPTSAIDCLIQVEGEPNVLGWRSIDRRAGDAALPDSPEVVFDRVRERKTK